MIKATINTPRNILLANNTPGQATINNQIVNYIIVQTINDLPESGIEKTFYLVSDLDDLYIWNKYKYIKISNDLLDILTQLQLLQGDDSFLKGTLLDLINKLKGIEDQTDTRFKELQHEISYADSSIESVKTSLEEYRASTIKELRDLQSESTDLRDVIDKIEENISGRIDLIDGILNDGHLTVNESEILKTQKTYLSQQYNLLSKEYEDAKNVWNRINTIANSDNPDISESKKNEYKNYIETFKDKEINFEKILNAWGDLLTWNSIEYYINNSNNIDSMYFNNTYGIKQIFELLLEYLDYIDNLTGKLKPNVKYLWYALSDALLLELNLFLYQLELFLDNIKNFDSQDKLLESLANINLKLNNLEEQRDGHIINWNNAGKNKNQDGSSSPWPLYDNIDNIEVSQSKNWPVSKGDWVEKDHINDTFVDIYTGTAYLYSYIETESTTGYYWVKITDSDITKALLDVAKLQSALDNMVVTFTNEPKDYKIGDVWIVNEAPNDNLKKYDPFKKGEILNCINNYDNSFNIEDWSKECSYVTPDDIEGTIDQILKDSKFSKEEKQIYVNSLRSMFRILRDDNKYLFKYSEESKEIYCNFNYFNNIIKLIDRINYYENSQSYDLNLIISFFKVLHSLLTEEFEVNSSNMTINNVGTILYMIVIYIKNELKVDILNNAEITNMDLQLSFYPKRTLIITNILNLFKSIYLFFINHTYVNVELFSEVSTENIKSSELQSFIKDFNRLETSLNNIDTSNIYNTIEEEVKIITDKIDTTNTNLTNTKEKLDSLFGDGKITPTEKRIILYKLYELFGTPGTNGTEKTIWYILGSSNNIGCFLNFKQEIIETVEFINYCKDNFTDSICPLVDFCTILVNKNLVVPNSGIFNQSTTDIDIKKFLQAFWGLASHVTKSKDGQLYINTLIASLCLFDLNTTETTNQDEMLLWITTYITLLDRVKTLYFLLS